MTRFKTSGDVVRRTLAGIAACAVGASALTAMADIQGPGLEIVARNGERVASWSAELTWNPTAGAWTYETTDTIHLSDAEGDLGVLNPNGEGLSIIIQEDPVVNLGFAVQAGAADTEFMIGSALLSFPTIPAAYASGRASVGMSTTDLGGNGVTLTGMSFAPGSGSYAAVYNGWAAIGGGTVFADSLPLLSAGPGGTDTDSQNTPAVGFAALGTDVSSMSSLVHFTLSAGDIASGTSTWVVIPEPSTVALLTLGLALLRRR